MRLMMRAFVFCILFTPALLSAAEQNTDRPGLDYRSFSLSSPNPVLCQQSCEADARCKAWTYVKPGVQGPTARCWLKHAVPQSYSNSCCVSGVTGNADAAGGAPIISRPITGCRTLREHYDKRCGQMRDFHAQLNCQRHGYSGCALDVAGCFTPYLPGQVFSDEACRAPGYMGCASPAYNEYVQCLGLCNKAAIEGRLPGGRAPCAQRCQKQIETAVNRCR